MSNSQILGAVIYEGPSMLDGSPIVVLVTGFGGASNVKTGADLLQVYILRADMTPLDAAKTGADAAICGTCIHRGEHDVAGNLVPATRSCYVILHQGPRMVYQSWTQGKYATVDISSLRALVSGRKVRLGAYGDPAAVPFHIWQELLAGVTEITGYTHAWRLFPALAQYVMASCDSTEDRVHAKALGFRTFRVASVVDWKIGDREVLCPASAEAGKKTTCDKCLACGGHSSKAKVDMMIPLHGSGIKAATRRGIGAQVSTEV
jgi:hypothetical protein